MTAVDARPRRARAAGTRRARSPRTRRATRPAARPRDVVPRSQPRAHRPDVVVARACVSASACSSRSTVVFVLVSAVVFHVVLAQGQRRTRPSSTRGSRPSAASTSSAVSTTATLASPPRIIEEASESGCVIPPEPPHRISRRDACRRADADTGTADDARRLGGRQDDPRRQPAVSARPVAARHRSAPAPAAGRRGHAAGSAFGHAAARGRADARPRGPTARRRHRRAERRVPLPPIRLAAGRIARAMLVAFARHRRAALRPPGAGEQPHCGDWRSASACARSTCPPSGGASSTATATTSRCRSPQTTISADPRVSTTRPRYAAQARADRRRRPRRPAGPPRPTPTRAFVYVARKVDDATVDAGEGARPSRASASCPSRSASTPSGTLAGAGARLRRGPTTTASAGSRRQYEEAAAGQAGRGASSSGTRRAARSPAPAPGRAAAARRRPRAHARPVAPVRGRAGARRPGRPRPNAKGGMAIVVDVQTGDVLAMAIGRRAPRPTSTRPRRASNSEQQPRRSPTCTSPARPTRSSPWRPRSRTAIVAPGHRVRRPRHDPDRRHDLRGRRARTRSTMVGGRHRAASRPTSARSRSRASSARSASTHFLRAFGFGADDRDRLPGRGRRASCSPLDEYNDTSIASIPIGYGIAVTAMQMLDVYTTIANGGMTRPPRLVAATIDADGERARARRRAGTQVVVGRHRGAASTRCSQASCRGGTGTKAADPGLHRRRARPARRASLRTRRRRTGTWRRSPGSRRPSARGSRRSSCSTSRRAASYFGRTVAAPVFSRGHAVRPAATSVCRPTGSTSQPRPVDAEPRVDSRRHVRSSASSAHGAGHRSARHAGRTGSRPVPVACAVRLHDLLAGSTSSMLELPDPDRGGRRSTPITARQPPRDARRAATPASRVPDVDGHRFAGDAVAARRGRAARGAGPRPRRVGRSRRPACPRPARARARSPPACSASRPGPCACSASPAPTARRPPPSCSRRSRRRPGDAPGVIGTIGARVDGAPSRARRSRRPRPRRPSSSSCSRTMRDAGVDMVAMEVSSHGLDAARGSTAPSSPRCASPTSRHDHLDYHGTLDEYFEAKARLFDARVRAGRRDQRRRRRAGASSPRELRPPAPGSCDVRARRRGGRCTATGIVHDARRHDVHARRPRRWRADARAAPAASGRST